MVNYFTVQSINVPGTSNYDYNFQINGVTVLSGTGRTTTINHTVLNHGKQPIRCSMDVTLNSGNAIALHNSISDADIPPPRDKCKKLMTLNSGSVRLRCKVGFNPDGAPTYLETLDKLDQWSSAHYVPKGGNKLNL